MHYDVTLHDVTAIINQIYTAFRNSLLRLTQDLVSWKGAAA